MTGPAAAEPAAALDAERGRTVIHDRVRRRLAEHAALGVPGVTTRSGLAARTLPAARVRDDGGTGTVDLRIATEWPVDGPAVVESVGRAVRDEFDRSLGDAPDVTVAVVHAEGGGAPLAAAPSAFAASPGQPDGAAPPRRVAGVHVLAVAGLLATIAVGVLAVRDAVVSFWSVGGTRRLDGAARELGGLRWEWWTWPVAIAAVVIGAVLLVLAITPGRRSHVRSAGTVWLSREFHRSTRVASARAASSPVADAQRDTVPAGAEPGGPDGEAVS